MRKCNRMLLLRLWVRPHKADKASRSTHPVSLAGWRFLVFAAFLCVWMQPVPGISTLWAAEPPVVAPPAAASPTAEAPGPLRGFQNEVDDLLLHHGLDKSKVALLLFSTRHRAYLYRHAVDRPMIPASNAKLFTTYAALKVLTPEYRWTTRFHLFEEHHDGGAPGRQGNGAKGRQDKRAPVRQGLLVEGSGDPTWKPADLERAALTLRALGITRLEAGIRFDGRIFDDIKFPASWGDVSRSEAWFAPVSPFIVNGNVAEFLIAKRGGTSLFDVFSASPGIDIVSLLRESAEDKPRVRIEQRWEADQGVFTFLGSLAPAKEPYTLEAAVERPRTWFYHHLVRALRRAGIEGPIPLRLDPPPTGTPPSTAQAATPETPAAQSPPVQPRGTQASQAGSPTTQPPTAQVSTTQSPTTQPGKTFRIGRRRLVYTRKSPPLREVMVEVNKHSSNLTAEVFLRTMGATVKDHGVSAEDGLAVLHEAIEQDFPEAAHQLRLVDGSGLSRKNRVTAYLMVRLLNRVRFHTTFRPEFINSLSVALTDGTLQYRYFPWTLRGRMRAKSGSLKGVATLSGYLQLPRDTIIFSMLINHPGRRNQELQRAQDAFLGDVYDAMRSLYATPVAERTRQR